MISKLKLNSMYASVSFENNTNLTWNNINLRVLLGEDVYCKYNIFKLTLTSISTSSKSAEYLNNEDASQVNVNISGLQFINGTYSHKSQTNITSCSLITHAFPGLGNFGTPRITWYDDNTSVYFRKSGNNCNINIFYTNALTDLSINYELNGEIPEYPSVLFYFNIEPIE